MQWLRKFLRNVNSFHVFLAFLAVLLLYVVVGVAYNHEAKAQEFVPIEPQQRTVPATLDIILVDPQTGAARAFACAPVSPPQQQGEFR